MQISIFVLIINHIGPLFIFVGLIIDVFDFAFGAGSDQLVWRALLHGLFIPMGTRITTLVLVDILMTANAYSLLVLSTCALLVGFIGLGIGSYELAIIRVSPQFFQRMTIDTLAVVFGYVACPLSLADKIKAE